MASPVKYPPELIYKVIAEVEAGIPVTLASRMHNIPRATIKHWVDRGGDMTGMQPTLISPQTTAKILTFDIECSDLDILISQYDLKVFNKYHKHTDIVRDWSVYSFAWKWLGEPSKCVSVSSKDVFNDEAVIRQAHDILGKADVWVGHNLDRFDVKKLNSRFAKYRLPKLAKKPTVDTLKLARRDYACTSNALSYLCDHFNVGVCKTEPPDWLRIKQGCPEALAHMRHYNRVDCDATEALYLFLNPRQERPVNLNLYDRKKDIAGKPVMCCPACGSHDITVHSLRYYQKRTAANHQCRVCNWIGTL